MTDKKKPSWFRWLDLLTIAGPGVVVLGLLAYALSRGADGPGEWPWLMALVGLTFIGVWARFSFLRHKYLSEFRWYPVYGLMLHPGQGYSLPADDVLDSAVRQTVSLWSHHFPGAADAVRSDVIWVFFKRDLNEDSADRSKVKVKGLTFARSHTMQVDYDAPDQPLSETAFEHELGHIIMGFSTGGWDQAAHHAFMAANALK